MRYEGLQHNGGKREHASASEASVASWGKEAVLEGLSEQYKEVQMQVTKLETQFEIIGPRTMQGKDFRESAIDLGTAINKELEMLRERKAKLEEDIRSAHGNPSDYTLQ